MKMTVEQLYSVFSKELSLVLRAGEKGLNRETDRLGVMETADFNAGANVKGMFVLTTLSFVRDPADDYSPVIELVRSCPAGIAVKTKRYVQEIPDTLIQYAEAQGVALFEITEDIPFSSFIKTVMKELVSPERIDQAPGADGEISSVVKYMSDESLEEILKSLESMLNVSCFFVDGSGSVFMSEQTAAASRQVNFPSLGLSLVEKHLGRHRDRNSYSESDNTVFPCYAGNTLLGVLVLLHTSELAEELENVVRMSLSFIAVSICERKIAELSSSVHTSSSVLSQILLIDQTNSTLIRTRIKQYGFDLLDKYFFMVVAVKEPYVEKHGQALIEYVRACLVRKFKHITMAWDNAELKCLVSFSESEAPKSEKVARDMIVAFRNSLLASCGEILDIGISLIQEDPGRIKQSYTQAQLAISLGRLYRSSRHVYSYHSFVIQGMLFQCTGTQEYEWIEKNVIEPISERDRIYESDLWKTLAVLFVERSLKTVAEELHIHISTLRYRIQKIEEVTGLDYFSPYGSHVLHTAYVLWLDKQMT